MDRSTVARLQALAAAALFSTGGAAIKGCSWSSWQVASGRSAIAALVLIAVFPSWRRCWSPRTLAVGAAYATTLILYVSANKLTTAANTIFLQSTAPLYLLFLGPFFLRERVGRAEWLLTSMIGVGMAMFFVGVEPPQATAPRPVLGNALGAIAGLTWALTILGLRALGRDDAPGRSGAGRAVVAGNLIAAAVCLPFALPFPAPAMTDLAIVGYLGVFQIGLAYVMLTWAVRRLVALEAALLLLLEPVLNALWAWAIHGEQPGPWSTAGCLIILTASLLRAFSSSRSPGAAAAG